MDVLGIASEVRDSMGTRAVNAHPDVQRAAGETHRMRQPGGHSMGLEPCEFDNAL